MHGKEAGRHGRNGLDHLVASKWAMQQMGTLVQKKCARVGPEGLCVMYYFWWRLGEGRRVCRTSSG